MTATWRIINGSGTTALVALQHGRSAIGIELNPAYVAMAETRIRAGMGMFTPDADAEPEPAPGQGVLP